MAISLRNQGPDIVLGLDPYILRQALFASLSGGPLTVGAVPGWVEFQPGLETFSAPVHLSTEGETVSANEAVVPEPGPMASLLIGVALFWLLPALLARISRP
jgi:hypothetical protein